ncbi:EVE domain-containing protein [bacterium]|nr:EVE domain-containing protein [bacterium]
MSYWLLKSDPETYSFQDLLKDGKTVWDGIRNAQARIYLKQMRPGDVAFMYHSQTDKEIVGTVRIVSTPYPDTKDAEWIAIDIVPLDVFSHPISLEQIKRDDVLKEMLLVKQSRLSTMPVTSAQAKRIEKLARI